MQRKWDKDTKSLRDSHTSMWITMKTHKIHQDLIIKYKNDKIGKNSIQLWRQKM